MDNVNNSIVYVVTKGEYSDYHIEQVFLDKNKAELYCTCHRGCQIEKYDSADDMIIKPMNELRITVDIKFPKYPNKKYNIQAMTLKDINYQIDKINEADVRLEKSTTVCVGYNGVFIRLYRKITDALYEAYHNDEIIETDIKSKYEKILQDMLAQIKEVLLDYGYDEWDLNDVQEINEVFDQIWK